MILKRMLFFLLALGGIVLAPAPAAAQSDILLQLRSGSPAGDRFRVDSAGGFVALGNLGIGIIPASGSGTRLMWHPFRANFRAGGVDGSQWDDGSSGFYGAAIGFNTIQKGNYSIAVGYQSQALLSYGIAMGYTANSNGTGAIAIGYRTTADGDYSVALGHRASANGFDGAMVMADASTTDSLEASANNQFSARYAGGYRLYTNATQTTGMTMNAGGSSWNIVSDRNRKEAFSALDGEDVLVRLRNVPVTRWKYKDEADRSVRHIGPMAQDWHAAFRLNSDNLTINTGDFAGINLAAIQALEKRTRVLSEENALLKTQISELMIRMQAIEAKRQD